jgi:protein-tyrosine phosphatase
METTGWRSAKRSGVRTIVDLRNADEIGRRVGDPEVDDASTESIERLHRPIEDQSDEEFEYFPSLLAMAIEAIVNARQAVVFHCSAGKDRTGLIAATLLTLNGVILEDVLRDYELGIRGYAAWQHEHPGRGHERTLSSQELDNAVEDRVRTLGDWLSETNVARLLVDGLGLDEATVNRAGLLLRPT